MLSSRDNWERLVAAALKREQFWQLCYQHSRSPSDNSTTSSDTKTDLSEHILNFPSNSLGPNSVNPSPQVPLTSTSDSQLSNNSSTGPITPKLFPARYRRRKSKDGYLVNIPEHLQMRLGRLRKFSLHELQVATENFSDKNIFNYGRNMVYKGWLADGSVVVVKGHKGRRDFLTAQVGFQKEVEINSIVTHRNVLHVLGFCITEKEWLLVYPLMVNGSVASCLRDRHETGPPLSWPKRKGIALGVARGLAYLHYECDMKIIHRDIKAANILLNEDFEAVVADFELAKTMHFDDTRVTTAIKETIGHLPLEYHSTCKCSEKVDVFGFGIFLLELITGERAFDRARLANDDDDTMLLNWVKNLPEERIWEMMRLMQIALLCTQSNPEERPKMPDVVSMLELEDCMPREWYKEEMFRREVQKHSYEEETSFQEVTTSLTACDIIDDDILDSLQ